LGRARVSSESAVVSSRNCTTRARR
jgi:hypothetical protein